VSPTFLCCQTAIWSIQHSSSSTAAIGYIFLPFEAAITAIPFFVLGFCTHYAVVKLRQRARIGYFFAAIAATLTLFFVGTGVNKLALLAAVNNVRSMPQAQHEAFLGNSLWRTNKFVLGALLERPDLSSESLHRIAMIPSPELHQRMWATPPIMGKNQKGLAVMRLIVKHPNVDVQTLVELSKSPDPYVQGDVASNPKTPVEILRYFFNMPGRDYLMDWGLAQNPNTPADILLELSKSPDRYTPGMVERNPSFVKEDANSDGSEE
jgi:hypothetical protein